jgi:hypothetical protein
MLFPAVAVAVLSVQAPAQAALMLYDDQASFLAAVSNPGTDSFGDLVPRSGFAGPVNRSAGTHNYTAAAPGGFNPGGNLADVFLTTTNAGSTIRFSGFGSDVYGVGGLFFGSNLDGGYQASPTITVTAIDSDGDVTTVRQNPNAGSFLGFVSTGGLSELTVTVGRAGIWPSIDNFTLAGAPSNSAVPEPATWAMMIVGFGVAGAMLRGAQGRRRLA